MNECEDRRSEPDPSGNDRDVLSYAPATKPDPDEFLESRSLRPIRVLELLFYSCGSAVLAWTHFVLAWNIGWPVLTGMGSWAVAGLLLTAIVWWAGAIPKAGRQALDPVRSVRVVVFAQAALIAAALQFGWFGAGALWHVFDGIHTQWGTWFVDAACVLSSLLLGLSGFVVQGRFRVSSDSSSGS